MSEEKKLISQENQEKMNKALETLNSIKEIEITNAEEYANAGDIQRSVAKAFKSVEGLRKDTVKPLNEKKALIQSEFKTVLDKLSHGKNVIGQSMTVYYNAEQAKLRAQQREQERLAEIERQKALDAARKEQDKINKYEAEGRTDMAEKAELRKEEKMEAAATTVALIVEQKATKGISYREDIEIEIIDKAAAVKDLMLTGVTAHLVSIDENGVKALIKSGKGTLKFDWCKVKTVSKQVVRS